CTALGAQRLLPPRSARNRLNRLLDQSVILPPGRPTARVGEGGERYRLAPGWQRGSIDRLDAQIDLADDITGEGPNMSVDRHHRKNMPGCARIRLPGFTEHPPEGLARFWYLGE